jgi:hypothetical protein
VAVRAEREAGVVAESGLSAGVHFGGSELPVAFGAAILQSRQADEGIQVVRRARLTSFLCHLLPGSELRPYSNYHAFCALPTMLPLLAKLDQIKVLNFDLSRPKRYFTLLKSRLLNQT